MLWKLPVGSAFIPTDVTAPSVARSVTLEESPPPSEPEIPQGKNWAGHPSSSWEPAAEMKTWHVQGLASPAQPPPVGSRVHVPVCVGGAVWLCGV